jgi:FAD/FMN-containing dehydrogenase
VFFFAVKDMATVFKLFHEARRGPFQLMAFETLTDNCMQVVTKHRGIPSPFKNPEGADAYVLMEVERPLSPDAQEVLDTWLAGLFEKNLVLDGTLAQSPREAKDLWSLREGTAEALYAKGFLHKNDIAVPVAALEGFIDEMLTMFKKHHPNLGVYFFGHIGDGNLHVNTMKPDAMDKEDFLKQVHHADDDLFAIVQKYHGSVSAEHGIGLLKKDALKFSRSPAEIALFHAMKKIFDPKGLLNPGKVLD